MKFAEKNKINFNKDFLLFEDKELFTNDPFFIPCVIEFENELIPCFKTVKYPHQYRLIESDIKDFIKSKINSMEKLNNLSMLEKSSIITIYRDQFNFDDEEILNTVFPLISIRKNKNNLEILKRLANSSKKIKEMCRKDNPNLNLLTMFFEFNAKDQHSLLDLFEKYNFSTGAKRNILTIIFELVRTKYKSVDDLVEELDLPYLEETRNGPEAIKIILDNLNRMKFPNLSRTEDKYDYLRKRIKTGRKMKLVPPEYFEDENFVLNIRFSSCEELEEAGEKLIELSQNKYMKDMLELT